jgi:hypothetical protein
MSAAQSLLARHAFICDAQLVNRHFSHGVSGVVVGHVEAQCVAVQSLSRRASEIPPWSCELMHACSHAVVGGCGHAWTQLMIWTHAGSLAHVQ